MRIIYVLLIWVLLVGGVALYMDARATAAPIQEYFREEAEGRFILEITPTFFPSAPRATTSATILDQSE